ncbi:MAG: PorT family protein [Cytophagales bacterium]|jgi:hypothetical protein|nr:PorT family protein [Cytophagales bacterium]MCE2894194.1 PorT family protein [Flammeovirgaceae bacterium]MCA6367352.1 PorT family protein [Cytophagales bacterium]MCA6371709.1 PorT family protein [Cytophagales bacterium]MCA6376163.1 PorT family protein [Cytophagales bacterium]
MKKVVFVLLFLFAVVSQSFSQASIALGVKGGLNFANVDASSPSTAYNSKTGYHAGAYLSIKLAKIGIQPEIIFSRQGSSIKPLNGTSLDTRFDYVNIPVILKLYLVGGLNLQAGPQFGFLASASQDAVAGGSVDIKNTLKSSDITAALGLGWDLPFGLNIDARYNLGLTKINDVAGSADAKNQVIQVSVGFNLLKFGN